MRFIVFSTYLIRRLPMIVGLITPSHKFSKGDVMEHVLIIHSVKDYEAWKKVFDNAASIRKEAGEQSYQVLRYENDANKIVHFSKWESIAKAKAFFESPRLAEIRKQAGVEAPEFIYLHRLENGVL